MKTIGKLSSEPDKDGKHSLVCPSCAGPFLSVITQDDATKELQDITCPTCGHTGAPLVFLHAAHKDEADAMVMDYAQQEISKMFRKRR